MSKRPTPAKPSAPNVPSRVTKAATRPSLHEDVTAALHTLGLALPAGALDAALKAAEQESLGLSGVLASPAGRSSRSQTTTGPGTTDSRAVPRSHDPGWLRLGVQRQGVGAAGRRAVGHVRLRAAAENVILVGQTGLGKSRILQSIGHAACILGYRVRYATSAKLLREFTAALADGNLRAHAGLVRAI